jgi:hypothetical protein
MLGYGLITAHFDCHQITKVEIISQEHAESCTLALRYALAILQVKEWNVQVECLSVTLLYIVSPEDRVERAWERTKNHFLTLRLPVA